MQGLQCCRLSLAFGSRDILRDAGLFLASGSRAALAGENGSGKTTLLKIIAGIIKPDSGTVTAESGCRVSYLPQAGAPQEQSAAAILPEMTLRAAAESAFAFAAALAAEMEAAGAELERVRGDGGVTKVLLEKHHRLQEAVEASGYYRREAAVFSVLKGLGFAEKDLDRESGSFSEGWRMRIALAKTLLENPDILLLDEPTNYLDIEARFWLENWLGSFRGGCLLVSHDRYFLDITVNEVYELFQGRLKRYTGNYSSYEKKRRQEMDSLLKRYALQQEEIAASEDLIRRFRYKASKAAMVQERIKRLEKMERIEVPESLKKISIRFPPAPRSGRVALTLEGIGKSYGKRRVLSGLDLSLDSGERLLVTGRNGAGKSTLLRIIAGTDADYEGKAGYGSGVSPAYFTQDSVTGGSRDSAEKPSGVETVLSFTENAAPLALVPKVRDMLGAFLFRGGDVYKPLDVLSGGERSRLALLKLLLAPVNFLVLDEPTNHLDLGSKDILLEALLAFTGTIVFVSHDRSFMEALSTKTLELNAEGPSSRLLYGGYGYYLERLEREEGGGPPASVSFPRRGAETDTPDTPPCGAPPVKADNGTCSSSALSGVPPRNAPPSVLRETQKQRQALIRRLERRESVILADLEKLESEKAALEAELAAPEVYSSGERTKAVKTALVSAAGAAEAKTAEWERNALELEAARASGPAV